MLYSFRILGLKYKRLKYILFIASNHNTPRRAHHGYEKSHAVWVSLLLTKVNIGSLELRSGSKPCALSFFIVCVRTLFYSQHVNNHLTVIFWSGLRWDWGLFLEPLVVRREYIPDELTQSQGCMHAHI